MTILRIPLLLLKETSHLLPHQDPHLQDLLLLLVLENSYSSWEKMLQAGLVIEEMSSTLATGSFWCPGGFGHCLSPGSRNNIPEIEGLKQQERISPSSEAWEVQDQGASRVGVW